jgi:N,N'-diacetyllegionaminate synthase
MIRSNLSVWQGKHGPLLIAEIGGNHEGDFNYALQLTDMAITSDVDYIKFQIYSPDVLVNKVLSPDRHAHFQKFTLSIEQYEILARKCIDAGVGFMASVWGSTLIDTFDKYMNVYKIGSGDLTAYPILHQIASFKKPIILSTGLATLEEVKNAVHFIEQTVPGYYNKDNFAILQCTSMYPIDFSDVNLNVMHTLKEQIGLTVGYSDHSVDNTALLLAVEMGAEVLEFHFTDTKEGKTFRDHKVSLTPSDVKDLISDIQKMNTIKGSSVKEPLTCEIETNHVVTFRRGVFVNKDIAAGYVIKEDDLVVLRPDKGISAIHFYDLIGKTTTRAIQALEELKMEYFED